ncbi:MAG: LysM domain [Rhodobacteraceae bacterium HLUCCA08]|nr:MAG: LysM domain [Rhodobacteraceae bacterium HLUCCA08]
MPVPEEGVAVASTPEAEAPGTSSAPARPGSDVAPPVLALDAEGVRVVQPATPTDTAPEVLSNVALDAITYDPAGAVELTGRAGQGLYVNIYVDNRPVATRPIDASGAWRSDLPQVDRGVYTLRIDEVAGDGAVVSRIETPFRREAPEAVAGLAAEIDAEGTAQAVTTVQPGNTLWAISRERYGSGILYVEVFAANSDRIRDPDLIYPGQVFVLPDLEGAAEN